MAKEDKRLKRKIRNSHVIFTVSVAMVLFLLGATTYLILNALNLTNRLKESVSIYVMLVDGLPDEQKTQLEDSLEMQDAVREVIYVSKEEAAAQFIAESGDDFTQFLDEVNPLPDSFEVRLSARGSEKSAVEDFVSAAETMSGVKEVVYQQNVIEALGPNLSKLNLILVLFGGALLFISIVLLANTIRMTIYAKRQIINTMKLVGANESFIMRPFLASAVLHGIYAGLIAIFMFAVMVFSLTESLPEINLLYDNMLLAYISGGMIVVGVIISLIFTLFAVDKVIKQNTHKIYM